MIKKISEMVGKRAEKLIENPLEKEIYWFSQGEKVEATIPYNPEWQKVKAVITNLDPYCCSVQKQDTNEIMLINVESMQRFLRPLKEEQPMTDTKPTWKEACQLIAKMFNELEWNDKKDWTAEEVFKTSPTGSRFHMAEYYPLAQAYFEMDPEERIKLKNHPVTKNGKFEFTVPETWHHYKLTEEDIQFIISMVESFKDDPLKNENIYHNIPNNGVFETHTHQEVMSLVNYLKGELTDETKEEEIPKQKKVDYQEVMECPNPYIGLEWTEQYAYYGKVVAKINRSVSFDWQENNREWRQALEETYYVIEDTSEKAPYILTADQFKKKFSYNDDGKKCWVRFKLNPPERNKDE